MAEQLGTAELQLDTDQAPLIRGLAEAEARVAKSVAVMQAMMDKLHADVSTRIGLLDTLAAKAASVGTGPGSATPAPGSTAGGGRGNDVWGIRGPEHPGSMTNPIVMVMEAAKYTPMGSYAAAIGESNVSDVQRGDQQSGIASAADIAALTSAVQDLAQQSNPASQLAKAGLVGVAEPHAAERTVMALDAGDREVFQRMASTLEDIKMTGGGGGGGGGHTIIIDKTGQPGAGGVSPTSRIIVAGPGGGSGNQTFTGPAASSTFRLEGGQYAGLISAIVESGKGQNVFLSGGGGGGNIPVAVGGGGGGGGLGAAGILGALGVGRGAVNPLAAVAGLPLLAGAGTAAGFAGLGLEHYLFTLLGIGGSAAAAVGGGGLLALGAGGVAGAGIGTDLAGIGQAAGDIKGVVQAQNALSQAIAVYGKNSTNAKQAQASLNAELASFSPLAHNAVLAAANTAQGFHQMFNAATGAAESVGAQIINQTMQVAETFLPTIGADALRNMKIIQQALQPLFAWLSGPQGMQILNDLENEFTQHLPIAMHAFEQGLELLLRVVDIASQDTGGFVTWLDKLFTRLNSESNMTLSAEIGKLVDDFRLWEQFAKLLVTDIYLLFHQDVGTGNSIIASLTTMLQHVKEYEQSTRGSAQIQNIFEVHKQEILEELQVIAKLADTFGSVYMAIAPPLVSVMNTVVLPVLNDMAKVIAAIASHSKAAAVAIGGLIIASKAFGTSTVFGALGGVLGLGRGAGAAAAGGGAAVSGAEIGGIGGGVAGIVGALGASAWGTAVVGSAVAAAASAALPILLGGGALYLAISALESPARGGSATRTFNASTGQLSAASNLVPVHGVGSRPIGGAVGAPAGAQLNEGFQPGDELVIQNLGKFSQLSATQLAGLIKEMKEAGGISVNGVNEMKNAVLGVAEAALKVKDVWNATFNQVYTLTHQRFADMNQSLNSLKDDWNSSWKLIAHDMGVNSNQGEKAVASSTQMMVRDLTQGMATGKISVSAGMAEIKSVLKQAMGDNAISWNTAWKDMFTNVSGLYSSGVISQREYLTQIASLQHTGMQNITAQNKKQLTQQLTDLQSALADGIITQQQYNAQAHELRVKATGQTQTDMAEWVAQMSNAMQQSGTLTAKGMQLITTELNKALGLFGANKLPIPEAIAWNSFQATGAAAQASPGGHFAQGGAWQIGQPGQAGHDTVGMSMGGQNIMVAPGEVAAVFTRHQMDVLNARLGDLGGLPGLFSRVNTPNYMAAGGYVYPFPGLSTERTDQGKDFGGSGPVGAIGAGTVLRDTDWSGWPGSGGIVYRLSDGSRAGSNVYIMEDFKADKGVGSRLTAGEIIGLATGGPDGIEAGWANASGTGPLTPYSGAPDGTATLGGQNFASFVAGLASGKLTGSALGAAMGALGSSWSNISSPGVKGGGAMGTLLNAALGLMTKGANAYGQAHATGTSGGVSGAGIHSGSWFQVASQIAGRHGWGAGQVQSWYGVEQHEDGSLSLDATNPSSGAYGLAQFIDGASEYARYGGNSTSLVGQLTAMANYIAGRYGTPSAALAHEVANSWYAGGGIVGAAEAAGAAAPKKGAGYNFINNPTANQYDILYDKNLSGHQKAVALAYLASHGTGRPVPKNMPKHAKKPPAPPPKPTGVRNQKHSSSMPGNPDMDAITASLNSINSVLTGGSSSQLGYLLGENAFLSAQNSTAYGGSATAGQFIISTDALGNPITPYVDWTNVDADVGQLQQLYAVGNQILNDYQIVLYVATALVPQIQKAIAIRKAQIAKLKAAIRRNLDMIASLKKALGAKHLSSKEKASLNGQIGGLETANTGSKALIGDLDKQVTSLQGNLTTAQTYTQGGSANIEGFFAMDPNGAIGQWTAYEQQLAAQIGAISPAAEAQALATAQAQSAGTSSTDQSQLLSLLEQQLQTSNEALYISQQQYGVLANLPPFGGSFAMGGMVPGPPGAARTVIAHGGEWIGQGGGSSEIHIHGLGDFVDRVEGVVNGKRQEISNWVDHDNARGNRARRLLPSARPLAAR